MAECYKVAALRRAEQAGIGAAGRDASVPDSAAPRTGARLPGHRFSHPRNPHHADPALPRRQLHPHRVRRSDLPEHARLTCRGGEHGGHGEQHLSVRDRGGTALSADPRRHRRNGEAHPEDLVPAERGHRQLLRDARDRPRAVPRRRAARAPDELLLRPELRRPADAGDRPEDREPGPAGPGRDPGTQPVHCRDGPRVRHALPVPGHDGSRLGGGHPLQHGLGHVRHSGRGVRECHRPARRPSRERAASRPDGPPP